jgi:hypothetical protein
MATSRRPAAARASGSCASTFMVGSPFIFASVDVNFAESPDERAYLAV